jgi:hypothetical protein
VRKPGGAGARAGDAGRRAPDRLRAAEGTRHNFDAYFRLVRDTGHMLMPTLETADAFDDARCAFRAVLEAPGVRSRILALRIGGNDLLALLGLRRPRGMTIYRTPLGPVIARLVTTFRPYGFVLTAPVFEHLDLPELLDQEVLRRHGLRHGRQDRDPPEPDRADRAALPGQAAGPRRGARHPRPDSPAVFKMDDSMCEVATHRAWAERMVEQSHRFGAHRRLFP